MYKKPYINFICFCLVLLLSSCESTSTLNRQNTNIPTKGTITIDLNTNSPEVTKTQTDIKSEVDCKFEKIYPADVVGELVNFSGDKPESKIFNLESETTIRVYWIQTSKENFLLSGTNLDPNLVNNPNRKLVFESFVGPSSGCVDATFGAGKYQINIESADGDWNVAVMAIKYK
jgi:hypothetical protein